LSSPSDYPPSTPAIAYSFSLDPWQQHAVSAIHRGDNVLVTAKTGSGKTLVGEYQIAHSLAKGKRVFYTTPIKSLSNQKYHDLKHLFPSASVGIMTGDIKSNPEGNIIVMTTEILRNLLFKQATSTAHIGTAGQISMDDVDAVVFDEVHYINDPDRGHVWEETLIMLPSHVKLILLSATIDSPAVFAEWLGKAKQRPIVLLSTKHRIVPLVHGVYDPTAKGLLPLNALKSGDEAPYDAKVYSDWLKGKEARLKAAEDWGERVAAASARGDSMAGAAGKVKIVSFQHQLNQAVYELQKRDLLPALFFNFSRRDCERYAEQISGSLLDSSDTAAVKHIISFHLHKYNETLLKLPQYHQITKLLERGIGFHHSGLLPLLKEIVELLFAKGYVRTLFCTETFAVGLNMPARTVVFLDLKKPAGDGADGFRPLRPDEYIQMAGRAGRRGKDTQGVVLYLPARKPVEPDEMRGILTGSLVPLTSRLTFHYDFLLKALHASSRTTAMATASKTPVWSVVIDASYWAAQRASAIAGLEAEIADLNRRICCIGISEEDSKELEEGARLEAVMKASINAARRRAAAELDRWRDRHAGPRWRASQQLWAGRASLVSQVVQKEVMLGQMKAPIEEKRITPVLNALGDWGALVTAAAEAAAEAIPSLTPFGVLATEINEGNPLLIARLYESQLLKGATLEEIVCTMGAFLVDREAIDKTIHPSALPDVSDRVKDILCEVDKWGEMGVHIDAKHGIESPETYWQLATMWVSIGLDWIRGEKSAAEIATTYDIYEGNLMRGLHKLANLVNEWTSLATLTADVDMLTTLAEAPSRLLRDIAQPESLYLRL